MGAPRPGRPPPARPQEARASLMWGKGLALQEGKTGKASAATLARKRNAAVKPRGGLALRGTTVFAMELCSIEENPAPPGGLVSAVITRDGWSLRAAYWQTSAPCAGTVAILPGRAEFIEKYFEVTGELLSRGFDVAILDWRGQGRSGRLAANPRKGHIGNFKSYELDLNAFTGQILQPFCRRPWFALAHSMGAAIALATARTGSGPFARMVLTAPMIQIYGLPCPRSLRRIARALVWLGQGRRFVPRGIRRPYLSMLEHFEGNLLTSDKRRHARTAAVIEAAPDLAIGDPTIGWANAAFRFMRQFQILEYPRRIVTPVLVAAAGADRIVDTAAAEEFARRLKAGKCITIPHARHEILMERDPFRELFWAAFDSFIPGEEASAGAFAGTGRAAWGGKTD